MQRTLDLSTKYSRKTYSDSTPFQNFKRLSLKYAQKKKETLIELALLASSLSVDLIRNQENELALEALEMTNPNFDSSRLDEYTDAELMGIINSSKGKYFELLVVDKLNNGESVGNLVLPDGFTAEMAESINEPGWDIQIKDETGLPVEYLQLKATDSTAYITQTLENYPDIRILTTEEVLYSDEMVMSSGIRNKNLSQDMATSIEGEGDTFFDNFFEGFNPLVPLCFIAASQGYKVVAKKSTIKMAIKQGKVRSKRALTVSSVGAVTYAFGFGWLTIPVTLATGVILDERKKFNDLSVSFGTFIPQLQMFNNYRQKKLLNNGIF